jgi:hypothetical protein
MKTFIIIGVHRTLREVAAWAGKSGFVPLTRDRAGPVVEVREIPGDTAERLMEHLSKHSTSTKYEFFIIPVVKWEGRADPAQNESGLILPHLH